MKLEIYDTTLRDGEQMDGAYFGLERRVKLFKLLDEIGVDYVELGWPIASKEIMKSFEECLKIRKNARIVAFGSTAMTKNTTDDENLKAIIKSGAKYACIFGKTWQNHIDNQLMISQEENSKKIEESISFLKENGLNVFYDAEHYFDAFKDDEEYAIKTLILAAKAGAERLILCDTNGGTLPRDALNIVKKTKDLLEKNFIDVKLGTHFHNDSGVAVANAIATAEYVDQVQGCINGIGERVGNLDLSTFLPDFVLKMKGETNVDLKKVKEVNEKAYDLAGLPKADHKPYVGKTAFSHKGGVHIDAINKGAIYEHIDPKMVGNKRILLLNSLGGRSGVLSIARQFGYVLDKNDKEVQEKIGNLLLELRRLEEEGYGISALEAEQFLLIEKYFGKEKFDLDMNWEVETAFEEGKEKSIFHAYCILNGKKKEGHLTVDGGPVDAAYKTIINILSEEYPCIKGLKLADYDVKIARMKGEESSVRTVIGLTNGEMFYCVGVDKNIIESAIEALKKGFSYHILKEGKYKNGGREII